MSEPVKIGRATLYLGDCRDVLPQLPVVDLLCTDPPYGIREATGDDLGPLFTDVDGAS